jgi:glutamyl-tRNA synthetase
LNVATTRLAPSPTGALHLGNARTFLINWMLARRNCWRVVLRIEDLDGPRIKRGADQLAIEDLRWLGIDWDEGPIYQSQRRALYDRALKTLLDHGDAYPCICTRRDVETSASAPHADDGSLVYPGTCRDRFASIAAAVEAAGGKPPAIRFKHSLSVVCFVDAFRGPVEFDVAGQIGDFVIAKADGTPAYQLAVVVDDAAMGVTDVVRGDDLLDSAARQILLYQHLKLGPIPRYWHLPLVVGPDGKRLAKRHGDTRLATYRQRGVPIQRLLALLARWCGLESEDEISLDEFASRFDLARLSRENVVMTPADDAFLRHASR